MVSQDARVESFLNAVDAELNQLSTDERHQVILKLRESISQLSISRGPHEVGKILLELGHPRRVAHDYLVSRGLRAKERPRRWLWIGMGLIAFPFAFFTFIVMLIWWGIVSTSREISGSHFNIFSNDFVMSFDDQGFHFNKLSDYPGSINRLKGSSSINPQDYESLQLEIQSGKVKIEHSPENDLMWDCQGAESANIIDENKKYILNLTDFENVECEFKIPRNIPLRIKGRNSLVQLVRPAVNTEVNVFNGTVTMEPDADKIYQYEIAIKNGIAPHLESMDAPEAVKIKVELQNGTFTLQD